MMNLAIIASNTFVIFLICLKIILKLTYYHKKNITTIFLNSRSNSAIKKFFYHHNSFIIFFIDFLENNYIKPIRIYSSFFNYRTLRVSLVGLTSVNIGKPLAKKSIIAA